MYTYLAGPSELGGGHTLADQLTPSQLGGSVYALHPRPPPLSDPPTALPRYMNFSFENKNPNQKPSIFPALIILPGTHRRYKNEKPSIKWVLFTNASHNTILHFVAIRFMSIQMLKSTQCTEVGFTNWYSCNKIIKTQISRQNLFWVFLNMQQSHNVLT